MALSEFRMLWFFFGAALRTPLWVHCTAGPMPGTGNRGPTSQPIGFQFDLGFDHRQRRDKPRQFLTTPRQPVPRRVPNAGIPGMDRAGIPVAALHPGRIGTLPPRRFSGPARAEPRPTGAVG